MDFTRLQEECFSDSLRAGWWPNLPPSPEQCAVKIALIHSEISEALEGVRKDIMDSHLPHRKAAEVELADAVIRIFDLAGAKGWDLEGAILEKRAYNKQRMDHKPENRAKDGGKKF